MDQSSQASTFESASASTYALVLEPDHPCYTQISDGISGTSLYIVRTEQVQKRVVTEVQRGNGETIALFEWRGLKSDLVTLGNKEPVAASNWMKKSVIPFNHTVTFKNEQWKAYKWKGFAPGLSLELYSEDNKLTPIAKFQKSRCSTSSNPSISPAMLLVDPQILCSREKLDQVVLSFLYLEKSRREHDEDNFSPLYKPRRRKTIGL